MQRISTKPVLDVRDLEVVLAVADAGSTLAAVKKLHLTQSAVSRALALAEEKLGVRLFERSARGLVPTSEGRRLIEGAGAVMAQLVALERNVRGGELPTQVRLVCECYTAYRWLPSALAALRKKQPKMEVQLALDHTSDPVQALANKHADVALLTTSSAASLGTGFVERPLFADEIVFVVSRLHPLASKPTLTRADLRAHTLVSTNSPPAEVRSFMSAVFGRARPKLDFLRFPLTEAIVDAARAGMGIAVLSEWIASTYLDDGTLVVKRLSSGPLQRPWRIAYRRELETAAEMLSASLGHAPPRAWATVAE